MFSWICKRVTYANVAMTLALVFAMTGAAYAAKKYLITSTKQISPRVLKSLVGKTGPAGAQGPAGPAGPAGAAGAKGETGTAGKDGTNGKDGATGKSVVSAKELAGANCSEGGSSFEVQGSGTKTYACNGEEGSPWTAGGTLPSGKTETGEWGVAGPGLNGTAIAYVPLSFSIPLTEELDFEHVHFYLPGEAPAEGSGCFGGTVTKPTAEKGNLCVYSGSVGTPFGGTGKIEGGLPLSGTGVPNASAPGASVAGSLLKLILSEQANFAGGTWAVTAP